MTDQATVDRIADRLRTEGHWVSADNRVREDGAAELLGIQPRTMRRWRDEGRGPVFVLIGRKTLTYRIADILAFIESRAYDPRRYFAA